MNIREPSQEDYFEKYASDEKQFSLINSSKGELTEIKSDIIKINELINSKKESVFPQKKEKIEKIYKKIERSLEDYEKIKNTGSKIFNNFFQSESFKKARDEAEIALKNIQFVLQMETDIKSGTNKFLNSDPLYYFTQGYNLFIERKNQIFHQISHIYSSKIYGDFPNSGNFYEFLKKEYEDSDLPVRYNLSANKEINKLFNEYEELEKNMSSILKPVDIINPVIKVDENILDRKFNDLIENCNKFIQNCEKYVNKQRIIPDQFKDNSKERREFINNLKNKLVDVVVEIENLKSIRKKIQKDETSVEMTQQIYSLMIRDPRYHA